MVPLGHFAHLQLVETELVTEASIDSFTTDKEVFFLIALGGEVHCPFEWAGQHLLSSESDGLWIWFVFSLNHLALQSTTVLGVLLFSVLSYFSDTNVEALHHDIWHR